MIINQLLLLNELQHFSSFREAASAMQISESTLRSALHHLENELNCSLIITNKKGYQLTATAYQILPHTNVLHRKLLELQRLQDHVNQAFSRKLSLASSSQYGSLLLTSIISKLLNIYPQAEFSLTLQSNLSLLQSLVKNQLDIALLEIHDIEKPLLKNVLLGLSLSIDVLAHDQMCFLIGANHPLFGKTEVSINDILGTSRLVNNDNTDPLTSMFFQQYGYTAQVTRVTNLISQRNLIAESNYASWQTLHAAKNSLNLYHDSLQILKISNLDWQSTLYCIHPGTNTIEENILFEKIMQSFEQHTKEEFPL